MIAELAALPDLDAMARFLTDRLRRAINVRTTCLLLSDDDGEEYRVRATAGGPDDASEMAGVVVRRTDLPASWRDATRPLRSALCVCDRDTAATSGLRDAMCRLDAEYAMPVQLNDRIVGILSIGPPLGTVALDDEDLLRLTTIASQTSAMIENARLFTLATRDPLTRVAARRVFDDRLAIDFLRSRRTGRPLSIVMADLDDFKTINDTLGHQAGDSVLAHVAGTFQLQGRATDLVARYGGEEFVLIVSDTDIAGALIFAEKLRARVEQTAVTLSAGRTIHVTVSLGVAAFDSSIDQTAEDLLRADAALYRAKRDGKNRVSH